MASVSKKSKTIQGRKWRDFCRRFIITVIYVSAWAGLAFAAIKVDEARGDAQGLNDGSAGEIPVMEIFLKDVTLDEVHENGKDVKYKDNIVILDGVEYDGVEFKGRGNFSWTADKKSYRIKFGKKVSLLGMNKSKKWALVANSVDDSLMRNDLAYYLMDLIVDGYQFRGDFVKLKINKEEIGVYYLIQTMDIGKGAVDLKDSMGVLVELDNIYCEGEDRQWVTNKGDCLTIKDAVADDNIDIAMAGFLSDFEILEQAASVGDFEVIEKVADVESLVNYFLISELTSNQDAYVSSWFFYKDGVDDVIHAGLAWDFDGAFGNRNWGNWPEEFYMPRTIMARFLYDEDIIKIADLMRDLIEIPEFRMAVREVFAKKIAGRTDEFLNFINERSKEISNGAKYDAELWNKGDFEEEVNYLKWWLEERIKILEEVL